jgi:hypothetical protein
LRGWLSIRGSVDVAANTGSFDPFYVLNTTSGYVPPTPAAGGYSLLLYDYGSNQVADIPFTPDMQVDETMDGTDEPMQIGLFNIPVCTNNFSYGIARVELWEVGVTNALAVIGALPTTPQFLSPPIATLSSNLVTLSWNAANYVAAEILFSPDNGATWETLDVDEANQFYTADATYLPATPAGTFQVILSDGFDCTMQTSSPYVMITNQPPTVSILSPQYGSLFIGDEQVVLTASATDMHDGLLDGTNVQWTLDSTNSLGSGQDLTFEADLVLSEGYHTLTVTATDSLNLSSSASTQIAYLSAPIPQLNIEQAGTQVLLSWPAVTTNYLLQSTPSLQPTAWTNILVAPSISYDQQVVPVDITPESQFFRLMKQ